MTITSIKMQPTKPYLVLDSSFIVHDVLNTKNYGLFHENCDYLSKVRWAHVRILEPISHEINTLRRRLMADNKEVRAGFQKLSGIEGDHSLQWDDVSLYLYKKLDEIGMKGAVKLWGRNSRLSPEDCSYCTYIIRKNIDRGVIAATRDDLIAFSLRQAHKAVNGFLRGKKAKNMLQIVSDMGELRRVASIILENQ